MAKRDRLNDRLSKIQVRRQSDKNNDSDSYTQDNQSNFIIIDTETDEQQITSTPERHSSATKEQASQSDKHIPATYDSNTQTPGTISLQDAKDAIRRQREEEQAQKLLKKEEDRRNKALQKQQRAEEKKLIQEQKKAEREKQRQAEESARIQRQQEEQERKAVEEQERARIRAEEEQKAAEQKAIREQQEASERAEREKREAAERAEREKREAAEKAEREQKLAEQRAEKERLEAERRRQKEEKAEAARLEKEEKQRKTQLDKQIKKEKAEAARKEKEEQKAQTTAHIPVNRTVEISDTPQKTSPINSIKKKINSSRKARANRKRNREGIKKEFHIFNKGTKAYDISQKIKGFLIRIVKFFRNLTLKKVLLTFAIFFVFVIAINRLPSLIYNWISPEQEKTEASFSIDKDYSDAIEKAVYDHPDEDFDGDLILNGMDEHPFDFDYDNNGIKDSDTSSTFALNSALKVGDVVYEPKDSQSGVSKFLNYYVFSNCKDQWIKFEGVNLTPYAYYEDSWHQVEFKQQNSDLYVYIPADYCYISLIETTAKEITTVKVFGKELTSYSTDSFGGKMFNVFFTILYPYESNCPYDIGSRRTSVDYYEREAVKRDHISGMTVTKLNASNMSRFSQMAIDGDALNIIYHAIDEGKASLLSMQSDKGETVLIAYGYDYLGNLYVADYYNTDKLGKLEVKHEGKIIRTANGNYKSYTDITFNGC